MYLTYFKSLFKFMHSGSLEADTEHKTSSYHFHYTNFNIFMYSKVKKYLRTLYISLNGSWVVCICVRRVYHRFFFFSRMKQTACAVCIRKRKKLNTCHVVPNCFRIPIPKCHLIMLLFNLAQGIRKFGLLR